MDSYPSLTLSLTIAVIFVTSITLSYMYQKIKEYIIKNLLASLNSDVNIELLDTFFLITFKNGESVMVPYNEDLIYDEKKITLNIKGKERIILLKRGFDFSSKLNLESLK